jgi:hypothetical protein
MIRKILWHIFRPLGYTVMPYSHWEAYNRNMSRAETNAEIAFHAGRRVLSIIENDFAKDWSTGVPAEALADLRLAMKGTPENIRVMEPDISDEEYKEFAESVAI